MPVLLDSFVCTSCTPFLLLRLVFVPPLSSTHCPQPHPNYRKLTTDPARDARALPGAYTAGCAVPLSMTVFKIVATGELACYSVLDPSLKMHGSDVTLKDRLAALGAQRPFILPACMHHGDFIKPFKECFPDAQLVLTSGFTCPKASANSNLDCVRGLTADFVIPANRERRWKAKTGGTVARDDTAALKAALNDEIDFSHQLEMHSEEVCFIHRASKVLVTADVWYAATYARCSHVLPSLPMPPVAAHPVLAHQLLIDLLHLQVLCVAEPVRRHAPPRLW